MMTDLYQLTMMYGYFKAGKHNEKAVYDLFFRRQGDETNYAVCAGLEQVIELINNLRFEEEDIRYLRSLDLFDEEFMDYLREFRFTGEIYAIPEGTVVFPMEPLVRVSAPISQGQLVETALLNLVNHQTLIATKASRVVYAAQGDPVLEFGLRRAQGPDAGIYGARAAIIGGCTSTSNVLTAQMFGATAAGTHAHSWVMSFPDELSAFRAYANTFPSGCMLLVDTYDTLKSGIPNAITVFKELREKGYEPVGVRLDSGDLAYLSKQARKMLDDAGFPDARIFASSDLDEYTIADLKQQGAKIDVWGVGTRLITGHDHPALGGVYKLSANVENGKIVPKLKVSENVWKITNPGIKKVARIYGKEDHMAIADLIMLENETIDPEKPLTIFDPIETWKKMTLTDYEIRDLLVPVFVDGKQVYESPSLKDIQEYARKDMASFWDEFKRIKRPHLYKVDLSDELYNLKKKLLNEQK
ncbi:nicotinate phosphoribosyltransferase [Christensenella intestinihominis]|uniref:nicotinate phosphoribosyltransferase n=1 Tax=Christensenella intestinihominis TaxID=1851429 RepID=UPI0008356C4A|nr:nicotinate phosphoribosyltransferase [Christensenella intestinihominis]